MFPLLRIEFAFAQQTHHSEHSRHGRAYLVAHSSQKRRFGVVGIFGAKARLFVVLGLLLQPAVDATDFVGLFIHQLLKFLAVASQFHVGALTLLFQFEAAARLVPILVHGGRHRAQFVIPRLGNGHVKIAFDQTLHGARQGRQPADKIAFDVEPDDGS